MSHPDKQRSRTLSRRWVREVDRRAVDELGMNSLVLMENAGRGVADYLCGLAPPDRVVICCGKGNNAGDGFVIARHLDFRGWEVHVLLWAEPAELRGDAAANYAIVQRSKIPIASFGSRYNEGELERRLHGAAWIVDALLGTGATGEPRSPLAEAIEHINRHPAPTVAVDLPSGLDCDTGRPARQTVVAAHTCTFVAHKPGFLAPGADHYTGQVQVLEIGVPRQLLEQIFAEQAAEAQPK